ncbi:MAG: hypothetical protein EAX90_10395 [Candidatus Heimdallarchaeota archaeon]|nr:hypothetical protein [Candidatus Heimdallarchaeota archaeon]
MNHSSQKNATKIIFITGVSGSGKSTLVPYLKKYLPLFDVHDFDEFGVPEDVDLIWRLDTTDFWLKKAKDNLAREISTIISGTSVPSEILNSSEYDPIMIIQFAFMSIPDIIIQERLSKRGWSQSEIDAYKNWSDFLMDDVKKTKNHLIIDGTKSPFVIIEDIETWIKDS